MVAKNTFNQTQGKKVMSDDYKKQNLMTNLHHRMRDAEYNQTDLARCTGIAQPTISRLLSGRGIPNVLVVSRIADALTVDGVKVSVDQLLSSPLGYLD